MNASWTGAAGLALALGAIVSGCGSSASDSAVAAGECGDGACGPGESARSCPADCPASCGDGACTFGEACASCPSDCDCTTIAATPPMGWNSWNKFKCDVDEALIRGTADALVSSGMRDAGYRYVVIDDCWQTSRDAAGKIVADATRFPSGMAALADYVHAKGLAFGLYTCAGTLTCQGRPGSADHEADDMATYASWGVDYTKVDWCNTTGMVASDRYPRFRDGIAATGRPIVLSMCDWGVEEPWVWGAGTAQLWRTTIDIGDSFGSMSLNTNSNEALAAFAGPGHWNDPDMLEVGNGGMSADEYRLHATLWALMAAPLIAGNDVRSMTDETRGILTNADLVAVDQDPDGVQGVRLKMGPVDVWSRPLAGDGLRAVALVNRGPGSADGAVAWADLGLDPARAKVRDVWAGTDLGVVADGLHRTLASHAVAFFRVAGTEVVPPSGESGLGALPWRHAAASKGAVARDGVGGGGSGALALRGTSYPHGVGAFGGSMIVVHLGGGCDSFSATVGVDDASGGAGQVRFRVSADGAELWHSDVLTGQSAPADVAVALSGARELRLVTQPTGTTAAGDFADWVDAKLVCH